MSYDLKTLDVFAFYGTDLSSKIISLYTTNLFAPRGLKYSPSHVGVIAQYRSKHLLFESTTFCGHNCVFAQRQVKGVQAHEISYRIDDYVKSGGRVTQFRLVDLDELEPKDAEKITRKLMILIRRRVNYDLGHALVSGSKFANLLSWFPYHDPNAVFCSQLIALLLMGSGLLCRSNPSSYNPGRLIRTLVKNGTYVKFKEYR